MSNISKTFQNLKDNNKKALISYITAGYPSSEITVELVCKMAKAGCNIVELGIPFSDPIADGPIIQESSFKAILNGINTKTCFNIAEKIRSKSNIPLVFMTYYNLINSYGVEKFSDDCKKYGIDGLIVADLPPEEGVVLQNMFNQRDIDLIYLLAPTSTEDRIRLITDNSNGFVYLISTTGVTGVRKNISQELAYFVKKVKNQTNKPLCVGFGISSTEQAQEVAKLADGIIIGSKLIQTINENENQIEAVIEFIKNIRKSIDSL